MPQWKRYLPIRLGTRPVQAGPGSWVLIPGYFQVWQLAKRKVLIIYNLSVGKLARSANSRPRWSDTPYLWPAPNFSQFLTLLDPPSKSLINQELCLIFLQFCQNNKRLCIECNLSLDGVDTSSLTKIRRLLSIMILMLLYQPESISDALGRFLLVSSFQK